MSKHEVRGDPVRAAELALGGGNGLPGRPASLEIGHDSVEEAALSLRGFQSPTKIPTPKMPPLPKF